ncbi:hypothetical protein PIB30_019333 [Stylosanthes scabra]|uniref:Uncharacterized protein n=1 Tax=Stylosanthes scabra TaxID=79078 RepID=A0ABU6W9E8_9FABA|nr:hypothetical protein [Stylosanthes scabra]
MVNGEREARSGAHSICELRGMDMAGKEMRCVSERVEGVSTSKAMLITGHAVSLQQSGIPVIRLEVGQPDFQTPTPVSLSGINAIQQGHTTYTLNAGTLQLRQAISHKFKGSFPPFFFK